jgi:hypothetical protein
MLQHSRQRSPVSEIADVLFRNAIFKEDHHESLER